MIDLQLPLYRTIGLEAERLGVDAYAVGGVVRDHFLGRPCTDIDIVCVRRVTEESGKIGEDKKKIEDNGDVANVPYLPVSPSNSTYLPHHPPSIGILLAEASARALEGSSHVSVFRNFGTASFLYQGYQIEFVGARRESYDRTSRKPHVEDGTLDDDQRRRDFTVNALAICLNPDRYGELIDPFGGIRDMDAGILRTPLDPDITFSDDPLRMMRAVRFASQLGFRIEDETFAAISRNAQRLEIVSAERITTELNKIMLSPTPSVGLKLMQLSGLMPLVLPEVSALKGVETVEGRGHKDNFYHTMEVVDNIVGSEKPVVDSSCGQVLPTTHSQLPTNTLWLRWAALLHDVGKARVKRYDPRQGWTFHGHEAVGGRMVRKIFKRLRLPLGEEERYVEKLVTLHMRPIVLSEDQVTDSAVRRLLFDAGDDIDDLMALCHADITSKNPDKVRRHHANFELVKRKLVELEERDRIRNFQPPVSGQDIMDTFGIGPCREIGTIKDAIKDAILDGIIPNERPAAWQMMLAEAAKLGLSPKA